MVTFLRGFMCCAFAFQVTNNMWAPVDYEGSLGWDLSENVLVESWSTIFSIFLLSLLWLDQKHGFEIQDTAPTNGALVGVS